MSKFDTSLSLDGSSPELIRSFIKDRKRYFINSMSKSGILPFSAQYSRNMAHCLSDSPSSMVALDSDDLEPPLIDTSRMTARFIITTSSKDRHGDIVVPRGCVNHLKNYSRNPRVFFGHKTDELPIASARDSEGNLALEIFDDKIYSTAHFHCETRESEIVFRLIARKELQASSIGFLPVRASVIVDDDHDDVVDLETGEEILDFRGSQAKVMPALKFLEWDMIEWSVVPIPANQEALAAHLSRGHVEGEKLSPSVKKILSSFVVTNKKSSTIHITNGFTPENTLAPLPEIKPPIINKEVDPEKLNEVYKKYKQETNMSYTALKAWSESPCSKKASLSSGPIKRNLELLSTPKGSWTSKHITWANKTIAFNSRMRGMPRGKPLSEECPFSKRDISLKNWAYNPGKTPKPKKHFDPKITSMPPQGPSPGVEPVLILKKYSSIFELMDTKSFKTDVKRVRMAMSVLLTLQANVDIPEKIKLGVYKKLVKYYKLLDIPYLKYRNYSLEQIIALEPDLDFKEFKAVSIKEKNWFKSAMDDLTPPPAQGKPKKKRKEDDEEDEDKKNIKASDIDKDEDEDDEEKEVDEDDDSAKDSSDDDEEEKDENEDEEKSDDDDEEKTKAVDEDEKTEDEEEEKDEDEDEDPHHTAIKAMAKILGKMHDCAMAHTDMLKGIHDKVSECHNALKSKAEEEAKVEAEDEMKTLLASLTSLKSSQEALNKRLFEVTGRR